MKRQQHWRVPLLWQKFQFGGRGWVVDDSEFAFDGYDSVQPSVLAQGLFGGGRFDIGDDLARRSLVRRVLVFLSHHPIPVQNCGCQ